MQRRSWKVRRQPGAARCGPQVSGKEVVIRYAWTDAGDDPTWDVGDRHRIDGYFAPLFDAITPAVLDEAGDLGHVQGAYFGHDWRPGVSAVDIVREVSAEYQRLAIPGLRIMFNWEQHGPGDPEDIADGLEEWRRLRPKVNTSWSCEGMQGGWMYPTFVQRVLACRVRVVPQCFVGNMQRRESDVVKADVVRRGFPENAVSCFYDAAQLGVGWDGFCFTAGRLPA
jgi:hypothetical protein